MEFFPLKLLDSLLHVSVSVHVCVYSTVYTCGVSLLTVIVTANAFASCICIEGRNQDYCKGGCTVCEFLFGYSFQVFI